MEHNSFMTNALKKIRELEKIIEQLTVIRVEEPPCTKWDYSFPPEPPIYPHSRLSKIACDYRLEGDSIARNTTHDNKLYEFSRFLSQYVVREEQKNDICTISLVIEDKYK